MRGTSIRSVLLSGSCALVLALGLLAGCGGNSSDAAAKADGGGSGANKAADTGAPSAKDASGKPKPYAKLNKVDLCEYCAIAAGPDGTLHAIWTEQTDHFHPHYLMYRSSADHGKSWSDAKNLSDDEDTNHGASYCQVQVDGKGRVYAIWKYVPSHDLLNGPGGDTAGEFYYRCLEGGNWSKRVRIGEDKIGIYSWFACTDPAGTVHVVWSQMAPDAIAAGSTQYVTYADLVREATLDGAAAPKTKDLVAPKPLPTQADQDAAKAKGKYFSYAQLHARQEGFINLRGYVDANGVTRFVAEQPGHVDDEGNQTTGKQIVYFDGQKVSDLKVWEKYAAVPGGNSFMNPPALLPDAKGNPHLIRWPAEAAQVCVRDYPIEDGKLGDPTDIHVGKNPGAKLQNYQVWPAPGGKIAVLIGMVDNAQPADFHEEDYLCLSDGNGKWSAPVCVTDNAARADFFHKETGGKGAVSMEKSYDTRYAAVAFDKDGRPNVLMINNERSLFGITNGTIDGGAVTSVGSTDSPACVFIRL